MISFKQFLVEYTPKMHSATVVIERFKELGIEEAFEPFYRWIYQGTFKPNDEVLDRAEQSFYAIRSVLPERVLSSYGRLGTLYRGMEFDRDELRQIDTPDGMEIKNRIMAWAPKHVAERYTGRDFVLLHYDPKKSDVVLCMNGPTMKFLNLGEDIVINVGETILSLPIDRITRRMVYDMTDLYRR